MSKNLTFKILSQELFVSKVVAEVWTSMTVLRIGYRSFSRYFNIKKEIRAIEIKKPGEVEDSGRVEDSRKIGILRAKIRFSWLKDRAKRLFGFAELL